VDDGDNQDYPRNPRNVGRRLARALGFHFGLGLTDPGTDASFRSRLNPPTARCLGAPFRGCLVEDGAFALDLPAFFVSYYRPTGEYAFNALVLGAWGIPVGMVTGDDALAEEVEGWLPWAERVVVKVADGGHSATSVHPSVAGERVRAGAERAVRRAAAGELQVLRVDPPVVIEIDYPKGVIADFAALVPGGERVGSLGVRYVSDDPVTAFRSFLTGNRVAGTVD